MDITTIIIITALVQLGLLVWFIVQIHAITDSVAMTQEDTRKMLSNSNKMLTLTLAMAKRQGVTQDDVDALDS